MFIHAPSYCGFQKDLYIEFVYKYINIFDLCVLMFSGHCKIMNTLLNILLIKRYLFARK